MRYPLEMIETVRSGWPQEKPLSVRISSVDGVEGGRGAGRPVAYARRGEGARRRLIDCSSGGLIGSATAARIPRGLGFQVPFADEDPQGPAGIATIDRGPDRRSRTRQRRCWRNGQADLVAIGREALFDPNWPLHARYALAGSADEAFVDWPQQYGWWLSRREPGLRAAREAAARKA